MKKVRVRVSFLSAKEASVRNRHDIREKKRLRRRLKRRLKPAWGSAWAFFFLATVEFLKLPIWIFRIISESYMWWRFIFECPGLGKCFFAWVDICLFDMCVFLQNNDTSRVDMLVFRPITTFTLASVWYVFWPIEIKYPDMSKTRLVSGIIFWRLARFGML